MSATTHEPIEAVIISGARRGEIVRLPNDKALEFLPEDIRELDHALDALNVSVERVLKELRCALDSLRPKEKAG